ncbi:hypothetical protein QQF64_018989 [Cirrhinus molitorella]|uniref:Ig-like domain-containing protein n=1 Tax=Cirrhinus molitorella TaxID=172907 RepID=A0ABR3LI72_9TELE
MNSRLSPLILLLIIPGFVTLDQLSVGYSQKRICAVKGSKVQLRFTYSDINIKTVFWFNLQVRIKPVSTYLSYKKVEITCDTSCTLTSGGYYHWMKNGLHFTDTVYPNIITSVISDVDSFFCSHDQSLKHPSSSECLSQSGCWDVTYSSRRVCALVGSTVDISCTYSHPSDHTVNKTFWHYGPSDGRFQDVKDLREDDQFAGRVEYVGNKLRIKDLKISDSGEYRFRFITDFDSKYSGSPGVILTVTGTLLKSSPAAVSEGQEVILSCSTKCTLNDSHTYIWYKNQTLVTDGFTKVNKLYLDSVSNEELQQYSCAVGDPVDSTAFSHYTVTLLVFLPQFLIIAALWIWLSSSVSFIVCVNLHKVKVMNSRLSPLILMLLIPGFVTLDQLPVGYSQKRICAVKGSEVKLRFTYSDINIKTVFWFSEKQSTNWRKNNEPEDLTVDSDYSGRVKHQISDSSSILTISDVRERDSGEYQIVFIINDGVKHRSSAAISLTVTDLQLRIKPVSTDPSYKEVEMTCDTSCPLTSGGRYHWMKNGLHFTDTESPNIITSIISDVDSFFCSHDQSLKHPSSSECLSQSVCWDVTYSSNRVCALVGSTVDISCTYSHPSGHTVIKTFWHYGPSDSQSKDFRDLREDNQFAGRVEYVGNKLRIKDLKISDSGEYRFRFITDFNQYSGSPGVILTVTGTQTQNSPAAASEGQEVILSCSTNCTLNDNHTYIWYKNRRQVTDGFTKVNRLYLDSVSNEELQQYSCAVGDPRVQRSPESSVALLSTVIILCVLLIITLIGVLWNRRRNNNSSQKHEDTMESEQSGSTVLYDNAAALSTVCTQQVHTKDQNVHYSTINFKQSHTKNTSSPNAVNSTTDDVHYAAVKFS